MRPPSAKERFSALVAHQYGVITRAQARQIGLSDTYVKRAVKTGLWRRALPSVFVVTAAAQTWEQRAMTAVRWAGDGSCASHATAARLHGLEGIPMPRAIHVTTTRNLRSKTKDVVVHRAITALDRESRNVKGILTTDVPRTLLDLSAIHPLETVEIALDDALRKGLVSIDYLDRRLATMSGRGQRGCRNLRAMLLERRDVAIQESVLNTKCWRVLKKSKVMQPTCEYRLLRPNGEFVKRFDFAYPLARTAVEAHSRLYHSGGRDIFDREGDKHNEVIDEGWLVLYFTWKHLAEGGKGFLTRLDSVLMDRMGAMRLLRP